MTAEQFRRYYGALPEALLLVDGDGKILAANEEAGEMLGCPPAALESSRLDEWSAGEPGTLRQYLALCSGNSASMPGALTALGRNGAGPLALRLEGARVDGSILLRLRRRAETTARFLALNERIADLNREIVERQRTQAELEGQREWLRTTLASIADGVIVTDAEGRVVLMNPVAEALTGWTLQDAVVATLDDVFRLLDEDSRAPVESPVAKVLRLRTAVGLANHTVLISRDGTEHPIDDGAAPIAGSDGRLRGVVLVFRDVTERRRRERELLETNERLERTTESLRQFAYAAAHDLQEPARNVALYTQLLERHLHGRLDAEAEEFMAGTIDSSRRMQRLIEDLLAYTRIVESQNTNAECDAREVLDAVAANLQTAISENEAEIVCGPLPRVGVLKAHLTQVMQNLISNALKYRGPERPRVEIEAVRRSKWWLFTVTDNGAGIAPEHHERIFKMFKRLHGRDIPGTGMGLAICERVVSHYGGQIWVESQPGRGAAFSFTLPGAKA
ncbi:MAG: ATP-binding protein [Bryobacteraceae bacterium]|nr:ATP-binding protein [Bryobacteraceae bacterium]